MIDNNSKLRVIQDNASVFTDNSNDAYDYIRDEFASQIAVGDYMYLGFYKQISSVYVEMVTPNTSGSVFTLERWDGSSWVAIDHTDETRGMSRSGFISWERAPAADDAPATTVNGVDAVFVRLSVDIDTDPMQIRGINLVFADDNALKQEFFEIDNANLLPPGESSHIVHHVSARNSIIQQLRNLGYIKTNASNSRVNLTQWDLFELSEVRQAAVHMTLSNIFYNLADSADSADLWWSKYRESQDNYEKAFNLAVLSVDSNDDGVEDITEAKKPVKVFRWNR